jgi:hypothetical protein
MEKITGPNANDYEFIKGGDNNIVGAVYPMKAHLKKENDKRNILGGSPIINIDNGMSRFDELGIPVGLYLETHHCSNLTAAKGKNENAPTSVIEDLMFDNLLNMVSSVKPHSSTKTRKNRKVVPSE